MKKYAEAAPIAINFTVDVDQGITVKPKSLTIQQGEHNARYFQVSLVHNEMPVNLANSEVHFLTQPHKSDEIPTTTNCEIYDAENGQVMVAVKDYMSNKSGIINGEFVRIGEDGSSLPFKNFTISVDGSIFVNDGLGQSEPLHSLVSALARVQRVEEYLEQEFMDVEAKYAGELSKTNAQLSANSTEVSLLKKQVNSAFLFADEIENFTSFKPNDFYAKFDKLISESQHLVTVTNLGKDSSNNYDIRLYKYAPNNFTKTIFLVGGIHGNERFGSYAIYRLFESIVNKENSSLLYEFIRNNCRIIAIPCANPWGMYQSPSRRTNANGVDINRNFDWKWSDNPNNDDNDWYKGTNPFSENESMIIKDILDKYVVDVFLDLHNFPNSDYDNKYHAILYGDDKTTTICEDLVKYATSDVSAPNVIYSVANEDSSCNNYASYVKGIPSLNIEGCLYSDIWDEKDALHWLNIYLNGILLMGNTAQMNRETAYTLSLNGKYSDNEVVLSVDSENKTLTRYSRELKVPSDGLFIVNGSITVKQSNSTDFSSFEAKINQDYGFAQTGGVNVNYGCGTSYTIPVNLCVPVKFNGNNAKFTLDGLLEGSGVSFVKRLNIYITFIPSSNASLSNTEVGVPRFLLGTIG